MSAAHQWEFEPPTPQHISTVGNGKVIQIGRRVRISNFDRDGICHCDPQPDSSPWGECPQCHRLDARTAE